MDKINSIKKLLYWKSVIYVNIPEQMIDIIYDLFVNNIEHDIELLDDAVVYLYFGVYYSRIKGNYDIAMKYYLKSIEKGNVYAMNNLALHYQNIEEYELAEKYYLK
jgi:tetratricopeptide (TPR) repeat protein